MSLFLAAFGSLLAASGTIPYVIETIAGRSKPRITTWLTWTILMSAATAGALADGQVASALFSIIGLVATGSIVVTGWRFGDRAFTKLDVICLIGVIVGLLLWWLLNSPAIAVWAAIIIDFIGLVPTIKHAYEAPREETILTYLLIFVGGSVTVAASAASSGWTVTSVGYPLYAAVSMGSVALLLVLRRLKRPLVPRSQEAPIDQD